MRSSSAGGNRSGWLVCVGLAVMLRRVGAFLPFSSPRQQLLLTPASQVHGVSSATSRLQPLELMEDMESEKAALYEQLGEILMGDAPFVDNTADLNDSDRELALKKLEESRRKYKAAKEEREQNLVEFEQKLKDLDKEQLDKLDAFIGQEKKVLDDFEKSANAVRKAQDTVETLSKELAGNSIFTQSLLGFDSVKAIAVLVGLDTLYVSYLAVTGSDNMMPSLGVEAILVATLLYTTSRRQSSSNQQ